MSEDTVRVLLADTPRTRWLFVAMALAGVALFGFATGVLMAPWAPALEGRLGELTCLQLAFTGERAAQVLGGFDEAQRRAIARLLVPGDLVFAFGYGLQLTGLLGLLTLRLPDGWQRAGAWLTWAPLVASVLDCFEDALLYAINAAADPAATGALPLLAGMAATSKYVFLSVVSPAFGLSAVGRALAEDRRPAALLLYALVALSVLAMVARPLPQILGCLERF